MATGKERGFKDWRGSKSFRRSARNYTETDEITRASSKSKNTRKWCKGKPGRKHTLALYNKYAMTHGYKCLNCGKELFRPNLADVNLVEKKWEDVN
jgi:hypothetical protein